MPGERKLSGLSGLLSRLPVRTLWRPLASGGAVLCFHSVYPDDEDCRGSVHVSLGLFRAIVNLLSSLGRVIPLDDLVRQQQRGGNTSGYFAITFDDAYAGILQPLQSLVGPSSSSLPVTVFVTTAAVEDGASFWWDRIDDLYPRVSPSRWRLFEEELGLPPGERERHPHHFGPLRPLRQWILGRYRGVWPRELEQPLRTLERETGYRTRQRSMTWTELSECAGLPGVALGIHTHNHPVLSLLTEEEVVEEIEACRSALVTRYDNVTPILAVPFGLYSREVVDAARRAGMRASLSVQNRNLWRFRDHLLPRQLVRREEKLWKLTGRLSLATRMVHGGSLSVPERPSPS